MNHYNYPGLGKDLARKTQPIKVARSRILAQSKT